MKRLSVLTALFLAASVALAPAQDIINPQTNQSQLTSNRGQLPGTTTNDAASAGNVGELISSQVLVGSAVALTTNVTVNVTSISLTAGDWDVTGVIVFSSAAGTVTTAAIGGISTTTAAVPTAPGSGGYAGWNTLSNITSFNSAFGVGPTRISLSGTTTVFLTAVSTFTTSTSSVYGYIGARRVR